MISSRPHKNSLELFGSILCPYVQRVQIALLEKNLEHQFIAVDLENKPIWLKDISPHEKVPVLKHENFYLYESTVINEYIEEVFPERPLMPLTSFLRATARIWINFCDHIFLPHFYTVLLNPDKKQREVAGQKLVETLIFMEHTGLMQLSDQGPYWLGDKITLVDITFFPFFERFGLLELYHNITIPETCPRLKNWVEAMKQLPSVIKVAITLEAYIKLYEKYRIKLQQ